LRSVDSLKAGAGHPLIRGVQGLARTAKWTAPFFFSLFMGGQGL
jgi:hypothetical protein